MASDTLRGGKETWWPKYPDSKAVAVSAAGDLCRTLLPGEGPCLQLTATEGLRGQRCRPAARAHPQGRRAASRRESHSVQGSELRDIVRQLELQGWSCWVRQAGHLRSSPGQPAMSFLIGSGNMM